MATGTPIDWSDEEITELSQLSVADIPYARAYWREYCRGRDNELLSVDTMAFDRLDRAMHYWERNVEAALEELAGRVEVGELAVEDFQLEMTRHIRLIAMVRAAIGAGGWNRLAEVLGDAG